MGLDANEIYTLVDQHKDDELFKLALIAQSRQLGNIIPHVFTDLTAEVELLLPNNLLQKGNVISDLIEMIPETDFRQIEIIGWLYQFYISQRKDEVFASKAKVGKNDIPAATQIFTPKWIVEYLVDNSLGRLWLEHHKHSTLRNKLHYYLNNGEQILDSELKPEAIKVLDPSCGSGHMLVYVFDVLYKIYLENGYVSQSIPKLILQNNLFGLDIDRRAAQLTAFSLVMKARAYDRRLFRRDFELHVQSIESGNEQLNLPNNLDEVAGGPLTKLLHELNQQFINADTLGSIIKLQSFDLSKLTALLSNLQQVNAPDIFLADFLSTKLPHIEKLITQYHQLTQRYDVVVTNPPYIGHKNMDSILDDYTKKYYPSSKADLFAVFMEVCLHLTKQNHYIAMINQHSWMFLSSFEKLRKSLLQQQTIINMVHLGARAFAETSGEVVQSTMFVMQKGIVPDFKAQYVRLVNLKNPEQKQAGFKDAANYFETVQNRFEDIPGTPIAYWASDQIRKIFRENPKLGEIAEPKQGLATANNKRFLRQWYEVDKYKIKFDAQSLIDAKNSQKKWFPLNKGGNFRKWFGNNEYVINWKNNGYEIKNFIVNGKQKSVIRNPRYYFREGITWSDVSTGKFGARFLSDGFIFETTGPTLFRLGTNNMLTLIAYVNSKVFNHIAQIIMPTQHFANGRVAEIPVINIEGKNINNLSKQNISLSKSDWDAFETSWDFQQHSFLQYKANSGLIADAFKNWQAVTEKRFEQLKANEEELNRQFIDIYGLQDELSPEEADKEVTVRKADQGRDIRSFLSYLVGIIFGRYSLDEPGLIYAGSNFDSKRYQTFKPDPDNVIPIGFAKGYYEDDVVTRIKQLLTIIFGKKTLMANLTFIAKSLYPQQTVDPEEALRHYFLKDFYNDHVKTYQKRPIYWELSSGKKNGFKALIYVHRYKPQLLAQIRIAYLLPLMRTISRLLDLTNTDVDSSRAKAAAQKQQTRYQQQLTELRQYETVVQYMANREINLDLDDGVKVNYAKFQNIEVPSEDGLSKKKLSVLAKVKL